MKRKLFRTLFALVLVLSMSLMTAVPAAAAAPATGYTLGVSGVGTAEWDITEVHVGSYSVELVYTSGDNAYVEFVPAPGTTMADLATIVAGGFWYKGAAPNLELRFTAPDCVDADDEFEPKRGHVDVNVEAAIAADWADEEVSSTTESWGYYGNDPTDGTPLNSGGPSGAMELSKILGHVNDATEMGEELADEWELTRVRLEIGWGPPVGPAYIDDVTIDGVTYEVEPPLSPLDEDYYAVGDEPIVTIYDAGANIDSMVIDDITVKVISSTDTVGDVAVTLLETGPDTGVFDGSFTLLGEAPADRDLDEIVVSEGDTITLMYPPTDTLLSSTALVDEVGPTITGLTPAAGTIQHNTTPDIEATLTDATSGVNEATIEMTVNGVAVITHTFADDTLSYTPSTDLPVGSTVEVTLDVADNAGNSAATASWNFRIAGKFNVSLTSDTTIPAAAENDIEVQFKDANGEGIQASPEDTQLASVQVTLSGAGVDEDSGVLITAIDTHTFSAVTPEQAGEIIITFVGTFGDASEETDTVTMSVTGYLVEETWADVGMETTGDISLRVTTKAGAAVNTGIVTITAAEADGFEKDVDGIAGDESFQAIVINGSTGEITYDDGDAEDFLVSDGYYEVTGITFANIGAVTIVVADAGSNAKASFDPAFTVLGINVYDLSFAPATLTAGVDLDELAITITEAGEPVTDVKWITIGAGEAIDVSTQAPEDGVYTVDPALVKVVDTLNVIAKNADNTRYGDADLEVALPTVSSDTEIMLTGVEYTVSVNITDAVGEPLDGYVWIGTYTDETFTLVTSVNMTSVTAGIGELEGVTPMATGTLVWKVGSGDEVANAALLLEPLIAVEALYLGLDWIPEAPEVGEQITFTVVDNYGEPAANKDVKVVSPGGDLTEKVTTPAGVFKYTATEDGDYYVSVGEQDPVTVTVVVTRLVSITATPESVDLYVEGAEELAITATYEDESTADVTADATYVSSDETVATVSVAGLVTAVAEGEATITVSYTEGVITKTAEVLVTVSEVPVLESIAASPLSVSLNVDGTQQLAITATYSDTSTADVTADAIYESDNVSVAAVSIGGLITAVAEGEATITVSYTEDEITVTTDVSVTVSEVLLLTIQLYEGANPILYTGATMDLPDALTNISEITEIIWQRDVSTGGEWWYYLVVLDTGQITQLENGTVYIIVVSEDCTWELSQ